MDFPRFFLVTSAYVLADVFWLCGGCSWEASFILVNTTSVLGSDLFRFGGFPCVCSNVRASVESFFMHPSYDAGYGPPQFAHLGSALDVHSLCE